MTRRFVLPVAVVLLSSCAYHRLVVANPDPGSEWKQANSVALGFGAVQRRTVAADCPTNLIDEVRVRQSFLDSLVTVATLGLVAPAQFRYACHKADTEEGTTGNSSAPGG